MKRVVAIAFLGIILGAGMASCGNGKHGTCEAYGNKSSCVSNASLEALPS